MKTISAVLLAAAAALALATAPGARADDANYLADLHHHGWTAEGTQYSPATVDTALLSLGRTACARLDQGTTPYDEARILATASNVSADTAADLVRAAMAHLCAAHASDRWGAP